MDEYYYYDGIVFRRGTPEMWNSVDEIVGVVKEWDGEYEILYIDEDGDADQWGMFEDIAELVDSLCYVPGVIASEAFFMALDRAEAVEHAGIIREAHGV